MKKTVSLNDKYIKKTGSIYINGIVVDIPGLRLTGYVNGKPYYGQVFAKDGNLYAGISETIGELVPVYATLQESILNRQTTRASAILRTGTEISRNDPTLNIPNTPDNLI